jgi:hypothetical protein
MKLSTFIALIALSLLFFAGWFWVDGANTSPVLMGAGAVATMFCAGVVKVWEDE